MKFAKFLVGLSFLVSAGAAAGSWYLYEQLQAEKVANQRLESQLVQLDEQNNTLKRQVAEAEQLKQEVERLRAQVKDYANQRDSVKKELDAAHAKSTDLQKQIQKLESEKKELNEKLNLARATETAVVQEATKLPEIPTTAGGPLPAPNPSSAATASPVPPVTKPPAPAKTEKPVGKPAAKIPEKETKKEFQKPIPMPTSAPAPTKGVEDNRPQQVLSVNRQFNFVVVNLGLRDHVKIGDTLRVEQKGKLIGRIQVEKLYENFSACAILEEAKPSQIHEGDLVRVG